MSAVLDIIDTPDGPFAVLADDAGRVLASGWTDDAAALVARLPAAARPDAIAPGATAASDAVRAYYRGDHEAILGVEVVQTGTDFQRAGWEALRGIEPGHPLSYAEFAARLGRPSAVRAAASICAANAPALFVPCHRVRRTDGSVGGFAWGAERKRALLAREAGSL